MANALSVTERVGSRWSGKSERTLATGRTFRATSMTLKSVEEGPGRDEIITPRADRDLNDRDTDTSGSIKMGSNTEKSWGSFLFSLRTSQDEGNSCRDFFFVLLFRFYKWKEQDARAAATATATASEITSIKVAL